MTKIINPPNIQPEGFISADDFKEMNELNKNYSFNCCSASSAQ